MDCCRREIKSGKKNTCGDLLWIVQVIALGFPLSRARKILEGSGGDLSQWCIYVEFFFSNGVVICAELAWICA